MTIKIKYGIRESRVSTPDINNSGSGGEKTGDSREESYHNCPSWFGETLIWSGSVPLRSWRPATQSNALQGQGKWGLVNHGKQLNIRLAANGKFTTEGHTYITQKRCCCGRRGRRRRRDTGKGIPSVFHSILLLTQTSVNRGGSEI